MSDRAATPEAPRFVPFGRYLLLERLAIGGMAEVYLAKALDGADANEASGLLAIKRVLPALAENESFIRMFLDEAKIAGRLRHPGIVRILELGRIGSSHYLAMDFVWGKDLLAIMRRALLLGTDLSPAFVAWVGASLAEALHYAHTKKDPKGRPMSIIHRDISPQNVLVGFDGRIKVIDFGIAKAQSRTTHTQAGVLKGKVGYMSPEQVRGETIDHRSDIFAAGTCLYEMLTLRSLFARENNFEAMENVREARVPPMAGVRDDVPEELERIVRLALQPDRDQRFASARDLQYALIHFLNVHAPGYDRDAAVEWMRDAFYKELRAERMHFEAMDGIGRAQLTPIEGGEVATDLEIPRRVDPPPPDFDDGETQVFDESPEEPSSGREDDTARTEIFFSSRDVPDEPATPWDDDGNMSLDPSEISSGLIERLIDAQPKNDAVAAPISTGATPPPRRRAGPLMVAAQVAIALLLIAVGALGAYALFGWDARSAIEVRTRPSVRAAVMLDGRAQGHAPVRLENVESGPHVVTLVAPGFAPATREVSVRPDETVVVEVDLHPSTP